MTSIKDRNENLKYIKNMLMEPAAFVENTKFDGRPCISFGYKKYAQFENWTVALSKLNNLPVGKNIFNELIVRDNGEVKPYFDIEYYFEQFDYQPEEVLVSIKSGLVAILREEWEYILNPKDILITQCHRQTPKGYKISFHVIISTIAPMVVFKSSNEAGGLANKLREFIIEKFDPSIIDTGVYKKLQNFRLIGHTKEGEDEELKKLPGIDRPDEDFLVTNISPNKKVLECDEQPDSLWKNMMRLKGFSGKSSEEQIHDISNMCKEIHPSCYFERIDSHGFFQYNYSDRSEECFTGNTHEKIGFFAFVKDKQVFMGCHSGRCVDFLNDKDIKKIKVIGRIETHEVEKDVNPVDTNEEFEIDYPLITKCIFDRSFGLARLFKSLYLDPIRLKYTTEKKLYYWDGELWMEDESMFLDSLLVNTLVNILRRYLSSFFDEVQDICVIENNEDTEKSRKLIVETTNNLINKMLDGLSLKQILNFVVPEITDKYFMVNKDIHPYFLACKNGLVDLKTGEVRNFIPEDSITKCLDTKYNPCADSTFFEKFVRDITNGDDHMYDYLRWAIGYSLQGKPNRKIYFILWGERGYNGKSLLLNLISEILNGYCKNMDSSVVLISPKKTAGSHSSELLHLENVRMGILSDLKQDEAINDGQIKQITGATDKISAREIFGKQREFTPVFVPFISTNHKPRINSSDEGLFDRTIIIPFEMSFVENPKTVWEKKSDPDLYDKLKKNKEGVLKWLVDCAIFYNSNLEFPVPQKIIDTKDAYKKEMNIHKLFIDDELVKTDDDCDVISEKDIFEEFKLYCVTNNYTKLGKNDKVKIINEFKKCLEYTDINRRIEFVKIRRKNE